VARGLVLEMDRIGTQPAPPPPDRRVAALAARQYGVVSRGQLRELGLSDRSITQRVAAGRLHRLHHGVYAVGHTVVVGHGPWMAAVLACGPAAVLSHASAGAPWDLRRSAATIIDVTVPGGGGRARHKGSRLHRARSLDGQTTTRGLSGEVCVVVVTDSALVAGRDL
jgi:Transcriptional regulator, AbiEi antitoxin